MVLKTRKEWFKTLEEPYRTQAINNTIQQNESLLEVEKESLSIALSMGFTYKSSPEGVDYWRDLYDSLGGK